MTSNINNYKFLSCLGKLFAHLVISPAPTKTTISPDCAVCFIIFGRFVNLSKDIARFALVLFMSLTKC